MMEDPVITRMRQRVDGWNAQSDARGLFLHCYMMMTGNMLSAIKDAQFNDSVWVDRMLHRFADYYFDALDVYEHEKSEAPIVWQVAHDAAVCDDVSPLEKLLLGVNAHINYDLVLTLVDMLSPEWESIDDTARRRRYEDHRRVNEVIGQTVDAVQDELLEPAMPSLRFVDTLLGPVDEFLISALITRWREGVWENATRVLCCCSAAEEEAVRRDVEQETLRTARLICRSQ